ncbi:AAA family ATPase [Allofranklinella schreckenbergeri]|uniref:AAA family ATPase n=2 Tax=Allofranklinella schreckenbergeri TaxID=1076744 RepID=A0A3M6Q5F8_9BURK|nr:AAA family ATPase [Allofranklinella schreckenbergeri]
MTKNGTNKRILRADMDKIDPVELRAAHLALRFWMCQDELDLSRNHDLVRHLWCVCLPLWERDVLIAEMAPRLQRLSTGEGMYSDILRASVMRIRQGGDAAQEAARLMAYKQLSGRQCGDLMDLLVDMLGLMREQLSSADWQALALADGQEPTHPSVRLLAEQAGFNRVEQCLLDMAEKRHAVLAFDGLLRGIDCNGMDTAMFLLAKVLACKPLQVMQAVSAQSPLVTMKLLKFRKYSRDLDDMLESGDELHMVLVAEPATREELLDVFLEPASASPWQLQDFPHLLDQAQRAAQALRQAATMAEPGVNALLYGPPGTGKTELAYSLAAAAGLRACRVRTETDEGELMDRSERLSAYVLLQRLLRHDRQCVLVFDEVEDVFDDAAGMLAALLGNGERAGSNKGWINRTLEENLVPAIWITNQVRGMDQAFLRRFMLPMAVGTPPLVVRQRIAQVHLPDDRVPQALREQLARDDKLQPAQFGMASRLLKLLPGADAADAVRQGIAASRRLLHGSGQPHLRQSATEFDLEFLNLAGELAPGRIMAALQRSGQGRLCFFGPPGTGKTEFAHVLAEALERELIVRTSAELMSKWVGETEQNIARLFDSIDPQRSILLLDEIDSLLRSRTLAEKSWEATQVNQLLQCMESFPGILIAATNLADKLDAAALRRFDFKLEFRPLKPEQRLRLLARETLGDADRASELPAPVAERLLHMPGLTAGDFANVARQRQLLGESLSAEQYLRRLMVELRFKAAEQGGVSGV